MRKLGICISKNKCADQLQGNCAADQRLCFSIIVHFKPLVIFYGCTDRFVLDLVGNPEESFLITWLIIPPDIYAEGYIVFAFPFFLSSVRMFVSSLVRGICVKVLR